MEVTVEQRTEKTEGVSHSNNRGKNDQGKGTANQRS